MSFLTKYFATLLPFTSKPTNDADISAFCFLSLVAQGFARNQTQVEIAMTPISALNSFCVFCRPFDPFSISHASGAAGIISLT
jgi:hypothetical protein